MTSFLYKSLDKLHKKVCSISSLLGNDINQIQDNIISEDTLDTLINNNHFSGQKLMFAVQGGNPKLMLPESSYAYKTAKKAISYNSQMCKILLFMDHFNMIHEKDIYKKLIEKNQKSIYKEIINLEKIPVSLRYSTSTESKKAIDLAQKEGYNTLIIPNIDSGLIQRSRVTSLTLHANNHQKIDYYIPIIKTTIKKEDDGIAKHVETLIYELNYNSSLGIDTSQLIVQSLIVPKLINYYIRRKRRSLTQTAFDNS